MSKVLKAGAFSALALFAVLIFYPTPAQAYVGGGTCFKYVGHRGSGDNSGICIEGGTGCSVTYCFPNAQ